MKSWTLRRRLVVGILALLAAASIVVGAVSVLALRGFLMDRLDAQLDSAIGRTQSATSGEPGGAPVPDGRGGVSTELRFGVQGPLTVTGLVVGEAARAGIVTEDGDVQILDDEATSVLSAVPGTGEPVTVDLGAELGSYRAAGQKIASGVFIITALPLTSVDDTVARLVTVIVMVAVLALAAAGLAGRTVVRLALRPLERVAATASAVTDLTLDRGEVELAARVAAADADPGTEVGRVGAAFNRMIDHVASALAARQRSENRVRRFVSDASHELRTPLTSIRGYAELTRRHRDGLPHDVAHSLERVESEAVRMTTLVEDLLLLARLDEGRELERGEVELSRLVVDTVSDATVVSPDHRWVLDLPEEPVTMLGDDGRLRQVITNLVANARVHTPAGTTVTVGLVVEGADAVLSIADDGPGVPAELAPRLFERFARGDSSRSRSAGSTGLGLAIVRAVVEGHGGSVVVVSEPGCTVFTVRLPRA